MDLCSFCCSEEADLGVASFDRIAAHIGISDDDLLDFESDDADAPNLASVLSQDKLQRPKFRSRVSSEVYRLEQSARRSREENQALQNGKGSQLTRNGGSGDSRRRVTSRRSTHEASPSEVSPVEVTRRKSSSRSFEGHKFVSGNHVPAQELRPRRSLSRSRQEKTEERPHAAQQAATPTTPPPQEESAAQRRRSAFRRLSDMSPEEKAYEKQRLQGLVKEFAKEAVGGFDLTLLDIDRGRNVTATFSIDRHLLEVTIDSHDDSKVPSAHFGVGSLTGVFKGEDFFSGYDGAPSLDLSTALVLTTKESSCPKIAMTFGGRHERDKAYTCLKILRLSVDLAKK